MPQEEKEIIKKPFKGVSENIFNSFQAQVLWPADMPDNILEDAITISKKAMEENDFETSGVEVSDL